MTRSKQARRQAVLFISVFLLLHPGASKLHKTRSVSWCSHNLLLEDKRLFLWSKDKNIEHQRITESTVVFKLILPWSLWSICSHMQQKANFCPRHLNDAAGCHGNRFICCAGCASHLSFLLWAVPPSGGTLSLKGILILHLPHQPRPLFFVLTRPVQKPLSPLDWCFFIKAIYSHLQRGLEVIAPRGQWAMFTTPNNIFIFHFRGYFWCSRDSQNTHLCFFVMSDFHIIWRLKVDAVGEGVSLGSSRTTLLPSGPKRNHWVLINLLPHSMIADKGTALSLQQMASPRAVHAKLPLFRLRGLMLGSYSSFSGVTKGY